MTCLEAESWASNNDLSIGNTGKWNSTHHTSQCQQALQYFVLLYGQLGSCAICIAGDWLLGTVCCITANLYLLDLCSRCDIFRGLFAFASMCFTN